MSNNNIKNTNIFLLNVLEIQDSTQNNFLRWQFCYFAVANDGLHRYNSFFWFILLLLGAVKVNLGWNAVTNCSIPLNTTPFYNWRETTMPCKCNSSGCYKAYDNTKWKIFQKKKSLHSLHLSIHSLLPKFDKTCFLVKHSHNWN